MQHPASPAPARPSASSPAFDQEAGLSSSSPPQTGAVDSQEILRGQKMMEINHNGLTYRLQATRLGKLILTK